MDTTWGLTHPGAVQPHAPFWALDSEFLMSGRIKEPEDVHSVQFSSGPESDTYVLESRSELTRWLKYHDKVRTMYAFVALPDLASVEEWLGEEYISYLRRGVQLVGQIKYGKTKITVYDSRPLLNSFGIRRLADAGKIVGVPKLPKPEWLGLRQWKSKREHEEFVKYSAQDAIITSRIVCWLYENFGADPAVHVSAGTLAKDWFNLPKRLPRLKRLVYMSPIERLVKDNCFAGRSEGFITGFTKNVTYNDVKSLYPCSLVATRALEISDVEVCDCDDLMVSGDLNETQFGWMQGIFETKNDLWGLPVRAANNFYMNGVIQGFFHTFDLAAAKATVWECSHCYRPVFKKSENHKKYTSILLRRLEGKLNEKESRLAKSILNALTGKLGQSRFIATTSNFFAYGTILAHSHLIMSKLFDKCTSPVVGMDTDSIFSQHNMNGKWFDLTDGEITIPVIMDVKGQGDLAFFRSKNYLLKNKDGGFIYGRHAWNYWLEDMFKLYDGVAEITTRKDIKHTLLTREKAALKMAKGRWRSKVVKLDERRIRRLVRADLKRVRRSYDSYQLVLDKKNLDSQAWNHDVLMEVKDVNPLDYPGLFYRIWSGENKIRMFDGTVKNAKKDDKVT